MSGRLQHFRTSNGAAALAMRAAGARIVTLPLQAVTSLLTAGVLIRHYGTVPYAQYALAISLVAILPFADLGIGAAVVNATAVISTLDERRYAVAVIRAALRALILVALVTVMAGIAIQYTAGWSRILGGAFDSSSNDALLACIVIFACTLPLSLGQRIALGIGANDRQVLLQGAQPLITLALVVVCVKSSASIHAAYLCFFASYLLTLMLIAAAADIWSGGLIRQSTRGLVRRTDAEQKAVSIFSTALPMCVVYIGLPFVLQTHRIMLSHFGDATQVAQYSLAAQMYLPVIAVVSAASTSLWSVFARERTASTSGSSKQSDPLRYSMIMAGFALGLCGLVTLLAPVAAPMISDGQILVSFPLAACFTAFVVAQAAQIPLGVYLTSVPGLRLQACTTLLFVPAVWTLAGVLIPLLGAGGPALATAAAGVAIQILPFLFAVRLLRRAQATVMSQSQTAEE